MNGQAHSGGHHGGHHPPRGGRGPSPTRRGVPNGPRPQTGSGRPGPQDYPPNFDHGSKFRLRPTKENFLLTPGPAYSCAKTCPQCSSQSS